MPGPKTRFSLQTVLLPALLLQITFTAAAESAGPHATSEESSPGVTGGSELLPHLEELAASENSDLDFVKRLYDFGLGKRAYSYVSEYKRLPVYNFGLGKRSKMYSFGLGKRDGGRLYSFGLGKRDYGDYEDEEDEDQSSGDENIDDSDLLDLMDKRERLYSFGLGKRARPYSFGLGKRASSGAQRLYGFGLGKRGGSLYSFGLGKRLDGRLYGFGLGKRPVNPGRQAASRFNFGLGKRSDDDMAEFEEDKRSPRDQRYGFGLGKREVTASELEAVRNEEKDKEASVVDKKNNTHDDIHQTGERVKRNAHFGFGKQASSYDMNVSPSLSEENEEIAPGEFARLVRRPFSFGLGKRIPMYDFGIGKRSER